MSRDEKSQYRQKLSESISLAPNLTEIVYAVGAGGQVVGNTTYCNYPPKAKDVAKVGDTLQPSIERILALVRSWFLFRPHRNWRLSRNS